MKCYFSRRDIPYYRKRNLFWSLTTANYSSSSAEVTLCFWWNLHFWDYYSCRDSLGTLIRTHLEPMVFHAFYEKFSIHMVLLQQIHLSKHGSMGSKYNLKRLICSNPMDRTLGHSSVENVLYILWKASRQMLRSQLEEVPALGKELNTKHWGRQVPWQISLC